MERDRTVGKRVIGGVETAAGPIRGNPEDAEQASKQMYRVINNALSHRTPSISPLPLPSLQREYLAIF